MSGKLDYLFKFCLILAVYIVTAKFGLTIDAVSGFATLVWVPTGLSLAALLILDIRLWPAISLGAFLANFLTGAPFMVALGISLGNTLEAIVAIYILKKTGFRNSLNRLQDVIMLILLAASVSTLISATIGVSSLVLGKIINLSNYFKTWLAWWIGDMVSNLIVAPLILVWSVKPYFNMISRRAWEAFGLTILIIIINGIIFREVLGFEPHKSPITYLLFPPLVWAALRFGQRGAVTTIFIFSVATIWATAQGYGPFVGISLSQRLLSLQFFMGVSSTTSLILGALAMEREKLEERKDEFISMASHELKTPITTIRGYGEILKTLLKKKPNKNILVYISKMEEQLNRLTKLVNNLLDVSKIQANKMKLQKEKLKIDDLIKDLIEDIQLNGEHQIIFEKDGPGPKAWVDKYLLSQVLLNLISNAIKYSPKANKIILKRISVDGGVLIAVQDFGIGISASDRDKVFQRFFQADTRIRQSFQGLGLGLYISSEIIKKHGGEIKVDSIKGKGSTFTIKLPFK